MDNKQKIIKRGHYSDSIANFLKSTTEEIIGKLALNSDFYLVGNTLRINDNSGFIYK